MKLKCQRGALAAAFQAVGSVVPSRTPKPVLQNVKLQVGAGQTVLIGTDGEIGIRYEVPEVESDGGGEVLLPTGRVASILRELRDDVVSLEFGDDFVQIKAGHSDFRLPVSDPAEFPNVAPFSEEQYVVIAGRSLRDMIRRTIFAIDPESTRYPLGGILLEMSPSRLGLVSTDSRRLALVHGNCALHGEAAVRTTPPVVPAKAMTLIERSLDDSDSEVWIAATANEVLFKTSRATIYSRLLEGRFPKYQDVIPKHSEIAVDLVAGPFYSAVRQAQIVTSDESRGVDFTFGDGLLVLKSQAADVGQSRIEMPISYTGKEVTITFDPRFVGDFLKVIGPETAVRVEMTDHESAAVMKTEDGYLYLIMPLARDR